MHAATAHYTIVAAATSTAVSVFALATHLITNHFYLTELEEMFPQTTPKSPDSTYVVENRKDEPENGHFSRGLVHRTPNERQTFESIQEIPEALHDENSDCIDPENVQEDLLSSTTTTEFTVAVNMVNHQTGIYNTYRIYVNSLVTAG